MPKRKADSQTSQKKKKKEPKKKQIKLGVGGVLGQLIKRAPILVDSDVLLTDTIYGRAIPTDMEGQLFHYTVTGYESPSNSFTVQYRNKMIEEDGVAWEHQDGERESMTGVDIETVRAGIILYNKKYSDVRSHDISLTNVAEAVQKKKGEDSGDEEFETDDLDEAAFSSEKGWFGQEVIDLEFKLTGETG